MTEAAVACGDARGRSATVAASIAAVVRSDVVLARLGMAVVALHVVDDTEIPDPKHIGGITAHPRDYARRVKGFFDRCLLDPSVRP